MCQMRVIFIQDGSETDVAENASLLEVVGDGIRISALFEEPRFIKNAAVHSIDFLNGRVTVTRKGDKD